MFKKKELIAHLRQKDKEVQSLSTHLKEVEELTGEYASKMGLKECGELIGLLHDIGKASREFQQYIKSAEGLINPDADDYIDAAQQKGKIDHSTAGAQIIYNVLSKQGSKGIIAAQILSLCIASHHSGLIDCLTPDGQDNYHRRMKKTEEKAHIDEVLSCLSEEERQELDKFLSDKVLTNQVFQKVESLKEGNDSKETVMFKCGLLVRFLFSCLLDADRLNTSDFEFPGNARIRNYGKYHSWDILVERLNGQLREFEKKESKNNVDILRNKVSQQCLDFAVKPKSRIYQLTVPTGGGKTLASLRFALNHAKHHKMERVFYIIPFTSIIDQNADEVRKILEDKDKKGRYLNKVVLEHHSNLTPEEETRRQNLLSENWDAPIVFTTQVQFLETLFENGTRSARRMHQLANSVIIFDEVQTIPVRCVHMFNVALRFLVNNCGSTVILCTATQPLLDNVEPKQRSLVILPEQQMIRDVKSLFRNLKRVSIYDRRKVGGWTENEVAELVEEEVLKNGSILIIVNTKASAQKMYEHLKAIKTVKVYHLSTNMCPDHRLKVLQEIEDRLAPHNNQPTICVSTQLIEAGIDIDFGTVVRYLAGLDSIAQAAGRCNRHGMRPNGNVYIVNPANENITNLKDISEGKDIAERILRDYQNNPEQFDHDILGPAAMKQYYEYYFYRRKEIMNYPVSSKVIGVDDNLFSLLSSNGQSVEEYRRINDGTQPTIPLRQSFQTAAKAFQAIDSPTRGIIVPYSKKGKDIIGKLCASFNLEEHHRLMKEAQRYSVNVYENVFRELAEEKAIHETQEGTGVFYLGSQYYSNEIGLSKEIVNEMESLIVSGHK
jgi:CRISPR-associated endonuclease/helicase Cas3